ncbi:hypothetical protein SARC_10247, partial [Sphaeroforma arctica JP610]
VGDQRCINSWSVDPTTVLTHHAIQHPQTKQLYVVEGNRVIRTWAPTQEKLTDGKSQKFKISVQTIVADARLKGVAVLFNNGKLTQTNCDLVTPKALSDAPKNVETKGVPHAAAMYTLNSNTKNGRNADTLMGQVTLGALYASTIELENSRTHLHAWQTYTLDTESMHTTLSTQYRLSLPAAVVSACMDKNSLTLSVVCDDGQLCVFDVSTLSEDGPNNPRFCRTLSMFRFETSKGPKSAESPAIAMSSAGDSLLAITGETPDQKYTMTLWETNYGTLQAQRELREHKPLAQSGRTSKDHRGRYQITQTRASNSTVFLSVCGRYVDICHVYNTGKVSLLSAIGRLEGVEVSDLMAINRTAPYKYLDTMRAATYDIPNVSSIVDSSKVDMRNRNIAAEWEKGMRKLYHAKADIWEMLQSDSPDEFRKGAHLYLESVKPKRSRDPYSAVSPRFLKAVGNRMLNTENTENAKFFDENILCDLVARGAVSTSSYPNIIEIAESQQSYKLLETCYLHMSDIAEPVLVASLRHVLDMSSADLKALDKYLAEKPLKKGIKRTSVAVQHRGEHPGVHHMLSTITTARFNEKFLRTALGACSLTQIMTILQFQYQMLVLYGQMSEKRLHEIFRPTRLPSLNQVITWIAVILDAEMARLVLFPDARQVLVNCKEAMLRELAVCEQAQDLQGFISTLSSNARTALPSVAKSSLYSIEPLQI